MSNQAAEIKAALKAKDMERARGLLREALRNDPDADTYYYAALAAHSLHQRKYFLERALEMDPFHAKAVAALDRHKEHVASRQIRQRAREKGMSVIDLAEAHGDLRTPVIVIETGGRAEPPPPPPLPMPSPEEAAKAEEQRKTLNFRQMASRISILIGIFLTMAGISQFVWFYAEILNVLTIIGLALTMLGIYGLISLTPNAKAAPPT